MSNSEPIEEVKCWFCKEIVEYEYSSDSTTIKDYIYLEYCRYTSKGKPISICLDCAHVNMPRDMFYVLVGENNGQ